MASSPTLRFVNLGAAGLHFILIVVLITYYFWKNPKSNVKLQSTTLQAERGDEVEDKSGEFDVVFLAASEVVAVNSGSSELVDDEAHGERGKEHNVGELHPRPGRRRRR